MADMTLDCGKRKTANLPWYKKYPTDWRTGTWHLSYELRGFYSECLDAMWEMQGQLPKDVAKLAILLAGNPRSIRKLIPQLIAAGKLIETASGYYNPRMMADILGVDTCPIDGEFAPISKPIEPELKPSPISIASEFTPNATEKPMITTREVRNQTPEPEKRESARDIDDGKRVEFVNGWLTLFGSARSFWLEQFEGDVARLELALTAAAPYVQPNGNRSLEVQVNAQLARQLADKRDRDKRYQSAAAKPKTQHDRRPAGGVGARIAQMIAEQQGVVA